MTRYLPQQDGLEPAFVLVEHYPDRQPRGVHARYHDDFFGETFDLVMFERRSLRLGSASGRRAMLQSLGTPDWRHIDRQRVEELIGEALDWQACTCRVGAGPH